MLSPAVLPLLLFASTAPAGITLTATATPEPRGAYVNPHADAELGPLMQALERMAAEFGDPLVKCSTVPAADKFIHETIYGTKFLADYAQLLRAFTHFNVRHRWPTETVRALVDQASRRLEPEPRALFIQTVAVSAEILLRIPALIPLQQVPLPAQVNLKNELAAFRDAHSEFRDALGGTVCGFAVARLTDPHHPAKATRPVTNHLVSQWFQANRTILRQLDPLQAALDDAIKTFPPTTRDAIVRIAYEWDTSDADGPSLVVWLVMRPETDAKLQKLYAVSGNIELIRAVGSALATRQLDRVPFFLRLRTSSELA